MPRQPRAAPAGYVYHAINRGVGRMVLFQKEGDYDAFERDLVEALARRPMRLLGYCVMPNHWHFVLWPEKAGDLIEFLRWLAHTHTQRWHAHYHPARSGHLYQGRFKAFPIQEDEHLYTVLRYVERNPLRAGPVKRAENGRWSSLAHRRAGELDPIRPLLHRWPIPTPRDWTERVNVLKPRLNWMRCAVRCSAANPLGRRPGKSARPNCWTWSIPSASRVGRRSGRSKRNSNCPRPLLIALAGDHKTGWCQAVGNG